MRQNKRNERANHYFDPRVLDNYCRKDVLFTFELAGRQAGKTMSKLHYDTFRLEKSERSRIRSQTFWGVARAMAKQWGEIL